MQHLYRLDTILKWAEISTINHAQKNAHHFAHIAGSMLILHGLLRVLWMSDAVSEACFDMMSSNLKNQDPRKNLIFKNNYYRAYSGDTWSNSWLCDCFKWFLWKWWCPSLEWCTRFLLFRSSRLFNWSNILQNSKNYRQ